MIEASHRSAALASLRVRQWYFFCALPLAGLEHRVQSLLSPQVPVAMLVGACCLAYAYAVNAVVDRQWDHSGTKNPLVGNPEAVADARKLARIVAVLGVLLACLLGPVAVVAALISLVCGASYSLGIAGKRIPVLGLILNCGIFVPLPALLVDLAAPPASFALEFGMFTFLLMQNQLIHELADCDEDREAGAHTTARLLGERNTQLVIRAIGLVMIPFAWWQAPSGLQAGIAAVIAILATLVTTGAAGRRGFAEARRAHRVIAILGGAALWLAAFRGAA